MCVAEDEICQELLLFSQQLSSFSADDVLKSDRVYVVSCVARPQPSFMDDVFFTIARNVAVAV